MQASRRDFMVEDDRSVLSFWGFVGLSCVKQKALCFGWGIDLTQRRSVFRSPSAPLLSWHRVGMEVILSLVLLCFTSYLLHYIAFLWSFRHSCMHRTSELCGVMQVSLVHLKSSLSTRPVHWGTGQDSSIVQSPALLFGKQRSWELKQMIWKRPICMYETTQCIFGKA